MKKLWLLLQKIASTDSALCILEFCAQNSVVVLEQPPFSPNLVLCDFLLFPKLKEVMKETCFPDKKAI